MKFSTSPSMFGIFEFIKIIEIIIINIGIESLIENIGLNLILSVFVIVFSGLDDPFSCSKIRCVRTIAEISIGIRKCREKNRFKVGWETEGPPQIHVTMSFPTIGMADRTPVMTVAPQNDICPHGSTYPRKAVAIIANIMMIPEIHTFFLLADEVK